MKLDVHWGYNNIRIKDGDEWKAVFCINRDLYKPLVMFFSLTNSPTTFQMMMNTIFHKLINKGKVVIYIDNIMIFTADLEEHYQIVKGVLEILQKNNIFLKPLKCEFETEKTKYLRLIMGHRTVKMNPVKVKAIADWSVSSNKKELQSFLRFLEFLLQICRKFQYESKSSD